MHFPHQLFNDDHEIPGEEEDGKAGKGEGTGGRVMDGMGRKGTAPPSVSLNIS